MKNYKYLSEIVSFHTSTSSSLLLGLLIAAEAPVPSNKLDVTKLRRALLEQLHCTSTNYSYLYCHCFLEFQTIAIVSISAQLLATYFVLSEVRHFLQIDESGQV